MILILLVELLHVLPRMEPRDVWYAALAELIVIDAPLISVAWIFITNG